MPHKNIQISLEQWAFEYGLPLLIRTVLKNKEISAVQCGCMFKVSVDIYCTLCCDSVQIYDIICGSVLSLLDS